MEGKMEFDLERHTLQSGVSCHSRTVTFAFRGSEAQYTGIKPVRNIEKIELLFDQ
jgi:hypothetical protein